MIQDIYPNKFSLEYKHLDIQDDDYVIVANFNKEIYIIDDNIPTYKQVKDILGDNYQFLFSIDDDNYFMSYDILDNLEFIKVRTAIRNLDAKQAFASSSGYHLFSWYARHQYCGHCGKKLEAYDKERALYCKECGQLYYPYIAPAVIVGVTKGEEILMSTYSNRDYKGYALIGGFCEFGEDIEDTCKREVMEEVGVKIKKIKYYKSQPWGVDSNLLVGFFAELDGDDALHVDHNELASAKWVHYKDIEENNNLRTLTSTMIEEFRTSFKD